MPIYVILALAAAFCYSLYAIWLKITSKYALKERNSLIFYTYLVGTAFLPIILLSTKIQNPLNGIIPLFLFCIAFFLGNFFVTTVLFRYDISVLHPFFHFQTIFSVSLAFLFLQERFPSSTYSWILLIIIGGVLVGIDEKFRLKAIVSKNFLIFLIGIFFYALSDIFAKKTMEFMSFYNLKFWSSLILPFMGLSLIPGAGKNIKISKQQVLAVLILGFFGFIAHLFFFNAISYNITISQPLAMFGSLLTFLISFGLSRIKPEFLEYHTAKIYALRGIGVLLMLSAAIMISLT